MNTISSRSSHRLGELLSDVEQRLRTCTLAQRNTLVNPALDAATWDEFVTALPEQAQ